MAEPQPQPWADEWKVIVNGMGCVYSGSDEREARAIYRRHKNIGGGPSKSGGCGSILMMSMEITLS